MGLPGGGPRGCPAVLELVAQGHHLVGLLEGGAGLALAEPGRVRGGDERVGLSLSRGPNELAGQAEPAAE